MSDFFDAVKRTLSSWTYSIFSKSGWSRRILLAALVIFFVILVVVLRSGINYQSDPSALVPRDAIAYFEARNLEPLLKDVAVWPVWVDDRRPAGDEQWNNIQVALANLLGDNVHGMGSRLPMEWLKAARRSAISILKGDAGEAWSWVLYLELYPTNASVVLKELFQEPDLSVVPLQERGAQLLEVSGTDASTLYVGAVDPWLVVSSRPEPLLFAAEAVRRPALTLGGTRFLPRWSRDNIIRGMFDPVAFVDASANNSHIVRLAGWMRSDSRFTVGGKVDASGRMDFRLEHHLLGEARGGGFLGWLVYSVFCVIAATCLVAILLLLATVLGWSGWLKLLAKRAGIQPAAAPNAVEPSAAFLEDAGATAAGKPEARTDPEEAAEKASDEKTNEVKMDASSIGEDMPDQAEVVMGQVQDAVGADDVEAMPVAEEGAEANNPPEAKASPRATTTRKPTVRKESSATASETEGEDADEMPKPRRRTTRRSPEPEE